MNKNSVGYIAIVLMLGVTSVFSINMFTKQRTDRDMFEVETLPHTIGEWKGRDQHITEKEYKILETRNLISRDYTNPSGEKVWLFIIYSETNRSVFHPPEVCLIGSGIEITDKTTDTITAGKKEFSTNKLYLEKNNSREISLYCYKVGNFYTDNFYLQQVYFAFNQLLGRRKPGATIRVSMPVIRDEKSTLATLKAFMEETINTLEKVT